MESKLTQYIIKLGDIGKVRQALRSRRDEILEAIAESHMVATDDVVKELAELNIAIGEAGDDEQA